MKTNATYQVRRFDLAGLHGISDKTLEMHFKLYEGYVQQSNLLRERIAGFLDDGKIDDEEKPAYSELKRRLGFEYNGMVLHEYYFENLTRRSTKPRPGFVAAAETSFRDYETWKTDFVGVGGLRGVGWAICYQDAHSGLLSNHWITLHEAGNIAGFQPILVMDVWEHAYLLDYKPAERSKYIEAFFANIDWECVERRTHVEPASHARAV